MTIPALPDTERRTAYSPSASTGPFSVGFALYGDGSDYAQWVQVWLNNVELTAGVDWTLSSNSGSLSTLARPITDAVITLTAAATGDLEIVGAQRPRRLTQLAEGRPWTAADVNLALTNLVAAQREEWDRSARALTVPFGETGPVFPGLTARQNGGTGGVVRTNADGTLSVVPPTADSTVLAQTYAQEAQAAAIAANGTVPVATRTAMAALDTATKKGALLYGEGGRNGVFPFNSSNLATQIISDPNQGVYVPPASDTSGASGAFVRQYIGALSPEWFGCAGDATGVSGIGTDDTVNFNACFAFAPANSIIDGGGKFYRLTSTPVRPADGVTVRNCKIFLDVPDTTLKAYCAVASKDSIWENNYFLGPATVGFAVTFTASVGGATSGTLTAAITNSTYEFVFSNGDVRTVTVTGGTSASWTGALTAGTVTTAQQPRYIGGIFGGNTGYSGNLGVAPANRVTITKCTFKDLTVGVWSGGASVDPVPFGWDVSDNLFYNIVGYAGNSEGYGIFMGPSSDSIGSLNRFVTVKRHAIYFGGGSSGLEFHGNNINGCDNIAIQSNTYSTESVTTNISIVGNIIRGLTRTISYGYASSIGIALVGNWTNITVVGNKIWGALDIGIHAIGQTSGSVFGDNVKITGNHIDLDATATDTGVLIEDMLSADVSGNTVRIRSGTVSGMRVIASYSSSTAAINVHGNTIETTDNTAVAFKVALSAARVVNVFRNLTNGFASATASLITDTSSAGTVRTDLNGFVGYADTTSDFTHYSGGTRNPYDCPHIRLVSPIAASHSLHLNKAGTPVNATVTVGRESTATGAFTWDITNGIGSAIISLSVSQWATLGFDGTDWQLVTKGTLP